MAKKYYAVRKGVRTGIFTTWKECEEQVKGYSGAEYKSFTNEEDAKSYIGLSISGVESIVKGTGKVGTKLISYVDGSYDDNQKAFSYGAVIFYNGKEEHLSEKFTTPDLISMRNVAGEIEGAKKVMRYCIENNIEVADIYYDYEGIEKWCTGEWRTRKSGTKSYKEYYDSIKDKVEITFVKVKGHSGNKYNDLADKLAKSALGLIDVPESIKQHENDMVAMGINGGDLEAIFELLREDLDTLQIDKCVVPYSTMAFNLSITIPSIQYLRAVYYANEKKLWLQGKREELFNELSKYIIELLEFEEVPKFLNTIHNLSLSRNLIEDDFDIYLLAAKESVENNKKLNNYLHQAVYNLRISGNVYNATFLVEPAMRSLEAVLKMAFNGNNIPIRKEGSNRDTFFAFKKNDKGFYELKEEFVSDSHSDDLLNCLADLYNHYYNHRHTLYHWDNPNDDPDTTRIIESVNEAHTLIKDTLRKINNFYKL